jgi:predicted HD phosphohydrolase
MGGRGSSALQELLDRLERRGSSAYVGEPLTVTEHLLQAARLAEEDGSGPHLIAAALLHDIGWLLQGSEPHETKGAALLRRYFDERVAGPVRLHVTAKRYLCAVDPTYLHRLSPASRRTLELQGGPLEASSVAVFETEPLAEEAIRLRRYDDRAKEPHRPTPPLTSYLGILEALHASAAAV